MTDRICKTCKKEFKINAPNQKYCSLECDPWHHSPRKKKATVPLNPVDATPDLKQHSYNVANGMGYIMKLGSIYKDAINNFNRLVIETHSEGTQAHAFEIINNLIRFLNEQIRGGKIIDV